MSSTNIFDGVDFADDFNEGFGCILLDFENTDVILPQYTKYRYSDTILLSQYTKYRYSLIRAMDNREFIVLLDDASRWNALYDYKSINELSLADLGDYNDLMLIRCDYNRRVNDKSISDEHTLEILLSDCNILRGNKDGSG